MHECAMSTSAPIAVTTADHACEVLDMNNCILSLLLSVNACVLRTWKIVQPSSSLKMAMGVRESMTGLTN